MYIATNESYDLNHCDLLGRKHQLHCHQFTFVPLYELYEAYLTLVWLPYWCQPAKEHMENSQSDRIHCYSEHR